MPRKEELHIFSSIHCLFPKLPNIFPSFKPPYYFFTMQKQTLSGIERLKLKKYIFVHLCIFGNGNAVVMTHNHNSECDLSCFKAHAQPCCFFSHYSLLEQARIAFIKKFLSRGEAELSTTCNATQT